jgi:hypothetical protein
MYAHEISDDTDSSGNHVVKDSLVRVQTEAGEDDGSKGGDT